jgi:hypothetical protein
MNMKLLAVAAAAAWMGLAAVSFGQNAGNRGGGASPPRCESMRGAAKDQCLRDETAKTQGGAVNLGADAPVPGTGLGTPAISPDSAAGSASRCDALSGAQKSACLRDEGSATSGESPATSGTGSADRAGPGSTGMGR